MGYSALDNPVWPKPPQQLLHEDERRSSPDPRGERSEAQQAQSAAGRLDDAVRKLRLLRGLFARHVVAEEQLVGQILPRNDDAPKGSQPDGGQEQPQNRWLRPSPDAE